MKDSDEGEAVKHSVDVIYLVIERTHHTGRLSFKSILFQHEPGVDQDQSKHHAIHVWMNTTTQFPFQYISVPLHEENPSKKANRATGWFIILIPHMHYCVPYKKNHQDQVKGFGPNCNSQTILKYPQPLWETVQKKKQVFLEQDHRCPRKYVRWGGVHWYTLGVKFERCCSSRSMLFQTKRYQTIKHMRKGRRWLIL